MNILISIFSYFIEFLISISFFYDVFVPKHKKVSTALIGILLYSFATTVFLVFGNVILNIFMFFIVNFAVAFLCFESKIKKSILSSLFLTAIMTSTEFLSMVILSQTNNGNINTYNSSIAAYITSIVFSKTLLLVFTKLSVSLGFHLSTRPKSKVPSFLFLFPVCTLVILYTFWIVSSQYNLSDQTRIIISVSCFSIIIAVFLTYTFYGKTSREIDELYKIQSEAERVNIDIAYYAILDHQNDILKTFLHDEKNHLSTIKSLASNRDVDAYIDNIYSNLNHYSMFGNTKNKLLDLTINKYQIVCKNENIDFSVTIKTANLSYIEQSDLISMLGNILDNAVESSKKSKDKRIDLSINKVNGFDILTCSNSCDVKPQSVNKTLKSTKSEIGFHGVGVKSIKRVVDKYHGEFEWSYDEKSKEFIVYIAFNSYI